MIIKEGEVFKITTNKTSYWFRVTKYGHLEHIYYGAKIDDQPIEPLLLKRTAQIGSSINYNNDDPTYSLDNICFEWSGIGRGDFRYSPTEIKMPDKSFVNDFIFKDYSIADGVKQSDTLPNSIGETGDCQTLQINMVDESNDIELKLFYTVFPECNVITRRAVIENHNEKGILIRRALSMIMDFANYNYKMITFDGGWIKEGFKNEKSLAVGMYINSSTTGSSSNQHNPGFLIAEQNCKEDSGNVYGFNLVYSGNHFGFIETTPNDLIRVGLGINPHCFEWNLNSGEKFETPEAILTFSDEGYNGSSENFHNFINKHIVRGEWQNKERPVLINSWEAYFFKFNQRKLLRLAKQAKQLGVELFVLDDGWFGTRDDDTQALGDYNLNRKKLPHGLKHFANKINKLGLDFGLWFEPEMVNENSDLFRKHPEYAVKLPGKTPTLGRNQMVLDLTNEKVRDYIVDSVLNVLNSSNISYVKWDMNRHISEMYSNEINNQGEFLHRYILGLYDILKRIFKEKPNILLESCSSGGNRFDLGMLCFSPQIWTSDNTDPISRLSIQGGLSYLYPPSTMGAHVSEAPHQQTLRNTPLSTRFNVSCFGCLGYELNLKNLTHAQKEEIKEQIAFYKKHRKTFQYGRFRRLDSFKQNQVFWQCNDNSKTKAISGFFQTIANVADSHSILSVKGMDHSKIYNIETKKQNIYIKSFGGLLKHITPFELKPDCFILRIINKYHALTDCVQKYRANGYILSKGILLNNQFMGTYYNKNTSLMGDYGSYLFITEGEN